MFAAGGRVRRWAVLQAMRLGKVVSVGLGFRRGDPALTLTLFTQVPRSRILRSSTTDGEGDRAILEVVDT
jgi:hypothetical protein